MDSHKNPRAIDSDRTLGRWRGPLRCPSARSDTCNQLLEQCSHRARLLDVGVVAGTANVMGLRRVHSQLLQRHHGVTLATCEKNGDGCARCERCKRCARDGEGARILREAPATLALYRTPREPFLARSNVRAESRDAPVASPRLLLARIPAHRTGSELARGL